MITLGSQSHRRILQTLVELFTNDVNILAYGVFGSLTRGDWDTYSDLDLDAVLADSSHARVSNHVKAMESVLLSHGIASLLIFEENKNEWVFILESLDRISIRFHTLEETSPNILDSFSILTGKLTIEDIARAASAMPKKQTDFELLQNKFLEHSIYIPVYLHRNELMNAFNMLTTLRNSLITIYCKSHGLSKSEKFDKHAPQELKDELAATFSQLEPESIKHSFAALLDIYMKSIEEISSGELHLTHEQKAILEKALSY